MTREAKGREGGRERRKLEDAKQLALKMEETRPRTIGGGLKKTERQGKVFTPGISRKEQSLIWGFLTSEL